MVHAVRAPAFGFDDDIFGTFDHAIDRIDDHAIQFGELGPALFIPVVSHDVTSNC